jgi:hypothetical protein
VKRLQISIEPELDSALERKARQEGKSKAALIREYVRERISGLPPLKSDPLWRMAGADSFDPTSIDETVYR